MKQTGWFFLLFFSSFFFVLYFFFCFLIVRQKLRIFQQSSCCGLNVHQAKLGMKHEVSFRMLQNKTRGVTRHYTPCKLCQASFGEWIVIKDQLLQKLFQIISNLPINIPVSFRCGRFSSL